MATGPHLMGPLTTGNAGREVLPSNRRVPQPLEALSSLWASRPRQQDLAIEESPCAVSSDLQMLQQSVHSHSRPFEGEILTKRQGWAVFRRRRCEANQGVRKA
ncbi:hypothetical protein HPP92_003233 [Vanilla planifolia]|uniref:Uncharacterized protein n=1 Tax=Vanilla planifolia TaxID=51239 RepID=A0A835S7X5_VANPL|nr:hypothetical protein HPP92_003233 [Vanilla planifolia]